MTSQLHHRPDTPENDQIILATLLSWTTYKPLSEPPLDPTEVVAMVTRTIVINGCAVNLSLHESYNTTGLQTGIQASQPGVQIQLDIGAI
ncbi:uncharacterized protein IAS62_005266 [Cryptococcus decagattii]|uniref:Uncharacterized protein n=1 Tax=Cryptococcus decagattii TaxID=1859122 RepID=A0ABZ2AZH9_9TREE